jgi:hypothetical protein
MSTLPKIRVKSGGRKIDIVSGTLPRTKGATYMSLNGRRLAHGTADRRILKYAG